MKRIVLLIPATLIVAVILGVTSLRCCAGTAAAAQGEQRKATTTFHVAGMTCGGCEVGVERAVTKLDGVEQVTASYKDEKAEVTYDPAKVTPQAIIAAIEKLGYRAKLQKKDGGGQ